MKRLSRIPGLDLAFIATTTLRRYRKSLGRFPNLIAPRTFNERITHRMIFDRDPRLPVICDKIAVKRFIADAVGDRFNVPTLGIWASADDVDFASLPIPVVLKPNHSSGPIAIVTEPAGLDPDALRAKVREWLRRDYYDHAREWAYRDLPRRLIAEPLLQPAAGTELIEAQVFTFDGRAALIRLLSGGKLTRDRSDCWFDVTGRRVAININKKPFDGVLAGSDRSLIIALAERLAAGFSSLRVDFYFTDQGTKVGELTPYAFGGRRRFQPPDLDPLLGQLWDPQFDLGRIPGYTHPV